MGARTAHLWFAGQSFSSSRRGLRSARLPAPERNAGANRGDAHSTYAEGLAANEPALAQRGLRHHRGHRHEDSQSDHRWGRNPRVLAKERDPRCRNSTETIAKSLVGNYRPEHLFALRQAVELYEIYQAKIADCEAAIAAYLEQQDHRTEDEPPSSPKPISARDRMRGGTDVRSKLYKMTAVDLFAIPGLAADTLLTLASEVGLDISPWQSEKHFTSWLALCPGTRRSGRRVLSSKTRPSANRAAQAFRMAAATQARAKTALGAFYRRIRARSGGREAITATAHKIARIFYAMLKNGTEYVEIGQAAYEQKFKERRLRSLKQQATAFGYQLTPIAAGSF